MFERKFVVDDSPTLVHFPHFGCFFRSEIYHDVIKIFFTIHFTVTICSFSLAIYVFLYLVHCYNSLYILI